MIADKQLKASFIDFIITMHAKLEQKEFYGYKGWEDPLVVSDEQIRSMLRRNYDKGDMVDVANCAMMLWARRQL